MPGDPMTEMSKLLPCPFCGIPAQLHEHHAIYDDYVNCPDTDCCGHDMMATPNDWNRRSALRLMEGGTPNWWMIVFDDADRDREVFTDEAAARHRYEQISVSWNAHLFVRVHSNTRDADDALPKPGRARLSARSVSAGEPLGAGMVEPDVLRLRNGFMVAPDGSEIPTYGYYVKKSDFDALRDRLAAAMAEVERTTLSPEDETALTYGREWSKDSSLETWFPFTAKELTALRATSSKDGAVEQRAKVVAECIAAAREPCMQLTIGHSVGDEREYFVGYKAGIEAAIGRMTTIAAAGAVEGGKA